MRHGRYFQIPAGLIFRNLSRYELEKIHSSQLRGTVRFRGPGCDGTDERAPRFDGADADAPRSNARFDSTDADAARSNAKLRIRLPPF
jgi:hypothetical protein